LVGLIYFKLAGNKVHSLANHNPEVAFIPTFAHGNWEADTSSENISLRFVQYWVLLSLNGYVNICSWSCLPSNSWRRKRLSISWMQVTQYPMALHSWARLHALLAATTCGRLVALIIVILVCHLACEIRTNCSNALMTTSLRKTYDSRYLTNHSIVL